YGEVSAPDSGSPDAETKVLWFDDEATGAVVLELRTSDRIGLLHRVAAALEGNAVAVRWARIVTLGNSVVDSFGLTGTGGHSALPPDVRNHVEHAVLSASR
ncbi:MAG: [protein-PII] uridylyltransferase, partial [Actinomycetota bacterium]|nr:[protein-PII] uridylyltransferase [Actinomycetota bacterium]